MTEFEQDYYAILGISPDADVRTVKRAFRQLARRFHPDRATEEQSVERFREIQQAYEVLVDPTQREAYNHWRKREGLDRLPPLNLQTTASQKRLISLGEPQALYVLVEVSASDETECQPLPLNLCVVLDRSTSMKGSRLHQVKVAARQLVDQMGPRDILSLVAFSDRAELILPGQRGIDKTAARAAIHAIRSDGGTELLQGLTLGLEEVQRWQGDGAHSHLILLTDGQTYGDDEACLEMAKQAGAQNISLTLMGVGSDWNDLLLDEMAHLGGGSSTSLYIDSNAKISQVFHDRLVSLGRTFAHDLVLSLHAGEDVTIEDAFEVSPEVDRLFVTDERVILGSLEREQPRAIMMQLLVGKHSLGAHRLLQVGLEGVVPAFGSEPVRARQEVEVTFASGVGPREAIPPGIVSAMGRVTIYRMQERAIHEIEMGQIEPAIDRLKTLATRLLDIGETDLARAALLEASHLAQTGSLSPGGRKKIRYGTRSLRFLPQEVRHG